MKTFFYHGILIMVAIILVGCATPAYRISKNQELFDSFSPEAQECIRQGRADIGFSRDMVILALDEPDRKYDRRTASGTTEIWSYTRIYTTHDRQRVEGRFRVRDGRGRYRTVNDSIWVDVDQEHEYEYMRIEFKDGKVISVEQVETE